MLIVYFRKTFRYVPFTVFISVYLFFFIQDNLCPTSKRVYCILIIFIFLFNQPTSFWSSQFRSISVRSVKNIYVYKIATTIIHFHNFDAYRRPINDIFLFLIKKKSLNLNRSNIYIYSNNGMKVVCLLLYRLYFCSFIFHTSTRQRHGV